MRTAARTTYQPGFIGWIVPAQNHRMADNKVFRGHWYILSGRHIVSKIMFC